MASSFAVYFVEGQVLAAGRGSSTGVTVRGMDEENLKKLDLLYAAAVQGGWDSSGTTAAAWPSATGWRRSSGASAWVTRFKLITPDGPMTPFGSTPQVRSITRSMPSSIWAWSSSTASSCTCPLANRRRTISSLVEDVLKPGLGTA
jgi:hypothetical protein